MSKRLVGLLGAALTGTALTLVAAASAAGATTSASARAVAYVRSGDVYVSRGTSERRLTTDGKAARPRWSPDGRRIAYVHAGTVWVMNADGSGKRRLSTLAASGPSWSPDGKWVAFGARGCLGGPAVYRVAVAAPAAPEALFPAECRGKPAPAAGAPAAPAPVTLAERLRIDDSVAWSPDGTRIAFRGGECEDVYDDCLTVGTVASGAERLLAGYGGGGEDSSGFAVLPAWRPDGGAIAWTAYRVGPTAGDGEPLHVVQQDVRSGARRSVGLAEDRELGYAATSLALVTGRYQGGSWIIAINLATGARTPLRPGSQPSVSPVG